MLNWKLLADLKSGVLQGNLQNNIIIVMLSLTVTGPSDWGQEVKDHTPLGDVCMACVAGQTRGIDALGEWLCLSDDSVWSVVAPCALGL